MDTQTDKTQTNIQIDRKIDRDYFGYIDRQERYRQRVKTTIITERQTTIEREEYRSSKSKRKEKGAKKNREI